MKATLHVYNPISLTSLTTLLCCLIQLTQSVFLPSIQWTPYNPILQNLNGKVRNVQIEDGLHIWCPKDYTQLVQTKSQVQPANLYFTLYKVDTQQEYDACDARKGKKLLTCDDPEKVGDVDYKLLLFEETPIFDIFEPYQPGKMYYFIGTSGGRHGQLFNKVGGKCATDHLKFAIYVCGKDEKDCNVDILHGGWSKWKKSAETGLCERNCTNPEPQNGGEHCKGPRSITCSEVIIEEKKNVSTEVVSTTTTTNSPVATETTDSTTSETEAKKTTTTKKTTERETTTSEEMETTGTSTEGKMPRSKIPSDKEKAIDDDKVKKTDRDSVTLSMKEAVLTFIGLFIVGCMVGIVQVLAILHLRNKRLNTKQPGDLGSPANV